MHSASEVFQNTVSLITFNIQNCAQFLRMTHNMRKTLAEYENCLQKALFKVRVRGNRSKLNKNKYQGREECFGIY